ncbi:MAG: YqaJ viral recombinase family protein [Planctomycetes bacterium]|nr:YqaJ viral recombinase family protein [Planctomycetota bacterium]
MTTESLEQGSPEWLAARVGKVTASRIADVVARTKTGWGAGRANYMAELIAERLTGQPAPQYTNAAMQWGTDTEPQARAAYEFLHDTTVAQVGLIPHPSIAMSAASPDGHVGDDGMVEIKCPNTATHVDTLLGQAVPDKYIVQMQWQMACAGRQWCDFVSYDPRMPAHLSLFVKRVPRDDKRIAELETIVREFLGELDAKVASLVALNKENAA